MDLTDMTHEELARHARKVARQRGDGELERLADKLQAAVDGEAPSTGLANTVMDAIEAGA